jgi:isoquinoline 1-oxidoreductase subunit beta
MAGDSPRTPALSRRALLQAGALAGGGLVLHAYLPEEADAEAAPAAATPAATTGAIALNAWLRIAADDQVTIVVSQAEMGQGISTTLPVVLAEELGADWSRVQIESSPVGVAYQNPHAKWQYTGNSESTIGFFELMRTMGAGAREMLIAAAATRLGVKPATCRAENGHVVHPPSGRSLRFGELAAAAARLPAPAKPPLKPRKDWRLLGTSVPRIDNPAKVDGTAIYGLDLVVPGMVYAVVKTSPTFGGKVKHLDPASVAGRPGVLAVVPIPDGVAVVAKGYWQARTALDALDVTFDDGPNAGVTTEGILQIYRDAMTGGTWNLTHPGKPLPADTTAITAEYRSQFLAHATMEPMNCTAQVGADGCDVWAPTQGQELTQIAVSKVLGLPRDKVRVHRTLLGGGFGRRLLADFAVQAVIVAKAIGRPVKIVWSREEDMQHDFYRPATLHRLEAALDRGGQLAELAHKLVSPSILQFVAARAVTATFDPRCVDGLEHTRYAIPSWKVEFQLIQVPVPTSALRTTGYGPNIFAIESFVDELAHHHGRDPYAYRQELLRGDPRALKVLDTAAQRAGWASPAPAGRFRGIAFCEAFETLIAHVVELSVAPDKAITIHRIVAAIDPGIVLDPDITVNSIEGGTAWGLSCAMTSEITFAGGRAVQANWNDYEVLRMPQMPLVDVHLVDSGAGAPGGVGEIGPVTVIPALANALFAATGQRIRSLPLARHGYRWA